MEETEMIERTHLVMGCPGAGKTHHLETVVVPQLVERYGADAVHCVSLTRAAATELGERSGLPVEQCRTLHSYAWHWVRPKEMLESWKGLRLWAKQQTGFTLTKRILVNREEETPEYEPDELTLFEVQRLVGDRVPEEQWTDRQRELWEKLAEARGKGLWDFTSLVWDMERQSRPLEKGVRAVVVDEAQDMSPLDLWAIRKGCAAVGVEELYLAGDPDQSIYEFRGASLEGFMLPVPEENVTKLERSRRCPRAVAEYAQRVLSSSPETVRPYLHWSGTSVEGSVGAAPVVAPRFDGIAEVVEGYLEAGDSVMVVASTNKQAKQLRMRLDEAGVLHRKFATEAGEMDNKAARALLRLQGVSMERPFTDFHLWQFIKYMPSTDDRFRWRFKEHTAEVIREYEKLERAELLDEYCEKHGMRSWGRRDFGEGHVMRKPEDEGRSPLMRDIADLPKFLQRCIVEAVDGMQNGDPLPALRAFYRLWGTKQRRDEIQAVVTRVQRGGLGALSSAAPIVDTIHQVKGGEADVVVLCPDMSKRERIELEQGHDDEVVPQMLRRFYVGLTRSRRDLLLMGNQEAGLAGWNF